GAAREAAALLEILPSLPIAIVARSESDLDGVPGRARALMEIVRCVGLDAAAIAARVPGAAAGAGAPLAADGADDELVELFREAVDAEPDAARSAAERFLFARLETLAATAGKFELNGRADFQFGGRAAEIDLYGREVGVAIEIDGYHHFRD